MRQKHSNDLKTLLDIDALNALGYINLDLEQTQALYAAKAELMRNQQMERLALEKSTQDKIYAYELARIENTLMAQRGAIAQEMSESDKVILQKKGADERQRAIINERVEFEKKSEMEKAQLAIQQGATVFNALGAQNKKAFEAAKALNIGMAIMNSYMAFTKALATYPFPFSIAFAGAALATGLMQVAQIRSQTYSGRALGGPVMGGTPYMVGESGPELFTPQGTGSITRNGDLGGGGVTNVNFTIVANDTTGFDQLLASRKGVIQQIISDAMLEKGRRSMV